MERPFISLNMASSIDGKITTFQKEKVRFSSDEDRSLMEYLRSQADAILIGAGTLRSDDPPLILRIPKYKEQREQLGKKTPHPINIVVSSRLDFPIEDSEFFTCPETEKVVFTTSLAPDRERKRLSDLALVVELPADEQGRVDLKAMARALWRLDIRHLLLEGGGDLNFAMLEQRLIDEIYLTVCPFAIGGTGSPTIFDGSGLAKEMVRKLQLDSCRVGSKGEVFLKYRVQNSANVNVEASAMFRKGFVIS